MTIPLTPTAAAAAANPVAVVGPTVPDGYVRLDDTTIVGRMLDDDNDIVTLAHTLREAHLLDASGSLLSSFARLDGLMEAAAIEIRMIRNHLGGA